MVFEPEVVQQVFRTAPERLCAGRANAGVEPLHGQHSLMVLGGDEHLHRRRLMLRPFKGARMRAYERVMVAAADRAIESWPVGEPFALQPSMYGLTLDVAIGAIFGVERRERADELKDALRALLEAKGPRSFDEEHRRVDELLAEEIRRCREAGDPDRPDVLAALVAARDSNGRGLSDEKVCDELVTLLIAGHETTANSLAWAFELLVRHPSELARLRDSLAAGAETYLDAVVKETLRLRPAAAGIGRLVVDEPVELGGYVVPAGIEISPSIEAVHHRADLYPEPREFRPERFLGAEVPDAAAWIPFGGGVRRCLGDAFATFEMKTTIRRVLERAELRAAGRAGRSRRRAITPPTRRAFARSLRRGRRLMPPSGRRFIQPRPPASV